MNVLSYIFTIIFAFFTIGGLLIGLFRGLTKTLIRLIWIVGGILVLLLTTSLITPFLINMDATFMNITLDGQPVKSIHEYVVLTISASSQIPPEQAATATNFAIALISMLLNGLLFGLLFLLVKLITLPLYNIVNLFFSKFFKGEKHVLLGGVAGLISGLLISLTLISPVTGYASLYNYSSAKLKESGIVSEEQLESVDKVISIYDNDPIIKICRSIGLEKYSLFLFDSVSYADYKGTRFRLNEEKTALLNALPSLVKLTKTDSAEEQPGIDEIVELISPILDSNIALTALKEFSPVIVGYIEKNDFGSDELAQGLKELIVDTVNNIPNMTKEQIKGGLSSIGAFVDEYKKISDGTSVAYGKLGKQIDTLISDGILNKQKIDNLAAAFAEKLLNNVGSESELYNLAQSVKEAFKNGVTSYEKELTAVGKIISLKDITSDEFSFEKSGAELGAKIDEILALNSVIINKSLVDEFIESSIDTFASGSLSGDFADCIETVKANLPKVRSYESEFGYIGKLIGLVSVDFSIENMQKTDENGKTLGQRLDDIAPSVLVGSVALDVIEKQLDKYSTNNLKHKEVIDVIKENYSGIREKTAVCGKSGEYKYSDIIGFFNEFYNSLNDESLKITDCNDLAGEAKKYDETLEKLQNNILLGEKGTRKIARLVADDVSVYVLSYIEREIEPYISLADQAQFAVAKAEVLAKITVYKDYLNRTANLTTEPYNSEQNVFANALGNRSDSVNIGYTRINRPFSYFAELLNGLTNN